MICRVIRHVNVHVQVGELLIVPFISVALRSGTLRRSCQAQFGQFGLLLLQTLFAPLNASVLEPDFDLETKHELLETRYNAGVCVCVFVWLHFASDFMLVPEPL